jgi:hypothetical protein
MKLMKRLVVSFVAFALLAGAAVPSFAQECNPSQRCVNDTILI